MNKKLLLPSMMALEEASNSSVNASSIVIKNGDSNLTLLLSGKVNISNKKKSNDGTITFILHDELSDVPLSIDGFVVSLTNDTMKGLKDKKTQCLENSFMTWVGYPMLSLIAELACNIMNFALDFMTPIIVWNLKLIVFN